jgi:hypothetical protein
MYVSLHVKYPLFYSHFNENLKIFREISKKKFFEYYLSWKSVQCKTSRSIRTVDMTKPIVAVCISANAPNKG